MNLPERATYRAQAQAWLCDHVERRTVAWNPGSAKLTRTLATQAADEPVSAKVVHCLGGHTSSVASRLQRNGLPTPKEQLAVFRLALAVQLAAVPLPVTAIAGELECSSPQAFGRHIRMRFGSTATAFFARWTPARFLAEALEVVMLWDDERWSTLDVLHGQPLTPYYLRPQVNEPMIRTIPKLRRFRTCCPSCGKLLVKSE